MLRSLIVMSIPSMILISCFDLFGDPNTTLIKELSNDAHTKKVVLLQNDGNATVDFSLQVSILNNAYKLTGKELGNTFVVDGNHGAAGLDSTSINFTWLSNDTLQIDYDQKLRTFAKEKNYDGVTILYKKR